MKRRLRRAAVRGLPFVVSGALLLLSPASGSEIPEWPHEQDQRLSELESELLDVQSKLFTARATNDEAKRIELEKRKKELDREHVKLLRATGQFPSR